ncbi:UDP-N-acetylmuramate dehydrogenase [Ilyobacter polytropus]|uniref:UDP-N-acetylenolpyruvoylglucosamine reductase n=1 Tax=Ilyobacter polytropus (strain ATCC 51220 / DSM 2926 / LMG 16218 / CuHBu1) TaxID=572544 RepID=E3H9U5_ILYPC|nr:UDP-N-acetylmuramate dehydrogenase [Ilyobacter polytropus]ADO83624.1 UDP-N-acetylmuramate dehydrogenase [Ilyobacter polytropus DSM 2926]
MKILEYHHMKEYSNMKIGGIAKELIIIEKKNEILEALKERENVFLIGNGTNTLISDGELDKTFISLKELKGIKELGNNIVEVEAGFDFKEFIEYMAEKDYSGLENLAGIPGSVGGLVYMNGGAYGTEVFDCIKEIEVVDENKEIRRVRKEDLHFTYRKTEIQDRKWIVLSAVFEFGKGFDSNKVEEIMSKRNERHPLNLPNLGSTFKNPDGLFSAKLIIEAGVQGKKIGGAQVSMMHPNFIVNHGNAKFDDILGLIEIVKERVKKKSGIELEEEIIIVRN